MSSPNAKRDKGFFDEILMAINKKTSHLKRIDLLSGLFAGAIKYVYPGTRELPLLDVGCGDMAIARNLVSKYEKLQFISVIR